MRWAVLAAVLAASPAQAAWKAVDLGTDVTLRAVAVVDGQRFHVSGAKGTHAVTEDGGKTWRNAVPPDGAALDFRGVVALDARTAILMSAGDGPAGQARLYRTDDAGRTWTLAFETRLPGSFLDTVAFRGARTGFVLGDPIDGHWFVLKTKDAGRNWTRLAGPPVGKGEAAFAASNSALFLGPGRDVWLVSGGLAQGRVARSRDDGKTWTVADTPIAADATSGLFGGLALDARRAVVVGGDYKDELRAGPNLALTDGRAAWTPPNEGTPRLLEGVGRLDARTLIAVGPRGTSLSTDNGQTWRQVDDQAFHAIACRRGFCVAAGAKGHVGVWAP
ncbi:WD40/YVTN/BNR-like repeat-containing protein [Phenylobacterium sp.]|uniref:WD40/YVTN/BNR-like repeat-containing protein n=1 Tax=Phenylobacterium sp. TaxID=1871053 RepID=UPI002ED8E363